MQVYFARHGETDWNAGRRVQGRTDTELNEAGRAQAVALAEKMAGGEYAVTAVYTSTMKRAMDTGKTVAERLNVPCEARAGLEEISLGDWEGFSWRQIEAKWPKAYENWERCKSVARPPNGESYDEVMARFVPAVLEIVRGAQGDVLIVSHSGCILCFQAMLNRTPLECMMRDYKAPNAEAICIDGDRILARWAEM